MTGEIAASLHRLLECLLEALSVYFSLRRRPPPSFTLFPYTTLFRSLRPWTLATATVRSESRRPRLTSQTTDVVCEIPNEIGKHTSELQSRFDLVCRLLLEKKKTSAEA